MSGLFTSSIGKKLMMSLAGVFLLVFLLVHLGINLLFIIFDDPMVYNKAAHIMSTNVLIKIFEIVLFGGILLHVIYALILQVQNWIARPQRYSKTNYSNTSFFSKFMIHTAIIILVFLVIHLADFYIKAKFGHAIEIEAQERRSVLPFPSAFRFFLPVGDQPGGECSATLPGASGPIVERGFVCEEAHFKIGSVDRAKSAI